MKLADVVAYVDDADRQMVEVEIVGKEVCRSDDAGETWRKTHDVSLQKVAYSYGYYFGKIWVSPEDAERVYVAGVPLVGSDDGGKTWRGLDRLGVHGDHHALRFAPGDARHVALGNDGGLNLSWDGGETWTKVNNLPVGQFTTIAVDSAEPYNVVCGLQDNGVMRGPSTYVSGKTPREAWKADLRRRRLLDRDRPEGPERRLHGLAVRAREPPEREDRRAGPLPPAPRARRAGPALQLGDPVPPLAPLEEHPLVRDAEALALLRPRRDAGRPSAPT